MNGLSKFCLRCFCFGYWVYFCRWNKCSSVLGVSVLETKAAIDKDNFIGFQGYRMLSDQMKASTQ